MWLNWGYNLVTSNLVADKLTITEVAALTKTLNTQNNIPQTWVYTRQCWHTGNSVTKTSNKLDAKNIKKKNKNKSKYYQNELRGMYRHQGTYPFLNKKIQGLFKDFTGHISHFSRTPFSPKKSLESVFFSSSKTWATLSWRSFRVCSF